MLFLLRLDLPNLQLKVFSSQMKLRFADELCWKLWVCWTSSCQSFLQFPSDFCWCRKLYSLAFYAISLKERPAHLTVIMVCLSVLLFKMPFSPHYDSNIQLPAVEYCLHNAPVSLVTICSKTSFFQVIN